MLLLKPKVIRKTHWIRSKANYEARGAGTAREDGSEAHVPGTRQHLCLQLHLHVCSGICRSLQLLLTGPVYSLLMLNLHYENSNYSKT
jgi:hypothetical protein